MTLVLKTPTAGADHAEEAELRDMTRRFWIGAVLTLPVFVLAMAHVVPALARQSWADSHTSRWIQFALTTLRRSMSKKQIVRLFKERYRTEQVYEEMKGELGLDHFEGRSFPGWHHHISVAICCYAFVVSERMRHFPPAARRGGRARPHQLAA